VVRFGVVIAIRLAGDDRKVIFSLARDLTDGSFPRISKRFQGAHLLGSFGIALSHLLLYAGGMAIAWQIVANPVTFRNALAARVDPLGSGSMTSGSMTQ
jgi:hypothetical protein